MSNTTITNPPPVWCFRMLAITACFAALPSLASAQKIEYRLVSAPKWQYHDLLKIIDVKSPYAETNTKAEPEGSETKTNTPAAPNPASRPEDPTTSKGRLPRVDGRSIRWHTPIEQVASSNRNIAQTTTSEQRDHSNSERGVALLKAHHIADDNRYTGFYWFHDHKLIAVVMKPSESWHWPKVNTALQQTYGTPSEDNSKTISNGEMQCVVKDRKWISERDGNIIHFRAQECNQYRHLNFYTIRYEPILTTSRTGVQAAQF